MMLELPTDGLHQISGLLAELSGTFMLGVALGLAFFWALQWTVQNVAQGRFGASWLIVSTVVRLAFFALFFVWLLDSQWERGLATFLGVLCGRQVVLHRSGRADAS